MGDDSEETDASPHLRDVHVPRTGLGRGVVGTEVAAENERWVSGLSTDGIEYEETFAELYRIVLKMAFSQVRRKAVRLQLTGPELDDVAHQAAADAALTICRKVSTFRGDCRFTTWAYRFVAFDVSSKINRHFWARATVSIDDNDWAVWISDSSESPEETAEGRDLLAAIHRSIDTDLTDRQQQTFDAIVVRGLPVAQVAIDMDSNPNAIYKMMFDARKKLRLALEASGYST